MPTNDSLGKSQDHFSKFILAENQRLDRLIHNLYLKFQLDYYSERDLYNHICQEVAQYFRADCASLYLIRYEEAYQPDEKGNKSVKLIKWLDLVGAFGPWRRALRPQYRRERSRSRYEIPFDEENIPEKGMGLTRKGFFTTGSMRFNSGYDFRSWREGEIQLRKEVVRNVVWYQDGLYNSCRCILTTPIVRESSHNTEKIPLHSRIGLIKLENRSPHNMLGFSDSAGEHFNHGSLFFEEEWAIAALRPYLEDLPKPPKEQREGISEEQPDPFLPIHNNVGWRQYFEDNPLGAEHFRQFLKVLDKKQKDSPKLLFSLELVSQSDSDLDNGNIPANLQRAFADNGIVFSQNAALSIKEKGSEWQIADKDQKQAYAVRKEEDKLNIYQETGTLVMWWYSEFGGWLVRLVECLIRVEAWLQHLRYALQVMCGVGEKPSLDLPIPSLFNVYHLCAAYAHDMPDTGDGEQGTGEQQDETKKYAYDALKESLLNLVGRDSSNGSNIQDLLQSIEKESSSSHPDESKLETDKSELESLIQTLCEMKAQKIREKLYLGMQTLMDTEDLFRDLQDEVSTSSPDKSKLDNLIQRLHRTIEVKKEQRFDIEQCLANYDVPSWNFQDALEIVKRDLEYLCNQLEPNNLRVREEKYYYLLTEEEEVFQIQKAVARILQEKSEEELCQAQESKHQDDEELACSLGCLVARALAAATGYADSFSKADELRLNFIAGHITQVLDNHLLHQARQRGLSLDFEGFDTLGLEQFGIGLLDDWRSLCQRIERTFWYLLRREAYRRGLDIPLPKEHESTFNLGKFVEKIKTLLDTHESLSDACHLLSIIPNGIEKGKEPILEKVILKLLEDISKWCERENLTIDEDYSEYKKVEKIEFVSITSFGEYKEEHLAKLKLERASSGIELRICFEKEAIRQRDFRLLWSGVKLLEKFLEVLNAITK